MGNLREICLSLLSSTTSADIATQTTKATLYTVPAGKACAVTHVVIRAPSGTPATSSISFGFAAAANDVIANRTFGTLDATTEYVVLQAKEFSVLGSATGTFGFICNTTQTTACTATVDTFGYIY